MNNEQINRYSASIYRSVFLLKLLDSEMQYLATFKAAPSGIKNEVNRLKNVYGRGIENLKSYMPNSKEKFAEHIKQSDEKISAIGTIVEKLSLLTDEEILALEDQFNSIVKVSYK